LFCCSLNRCPWLIRYSLVWKLVFFPKGEPTLPKNALGSSSSSDSNYNGSGPSTSGMGSESSNSNIDSDGSSGGSSNNSNGLSFTDKVGAGEQQVGGGKLPSICRPEWGPPLQFGSAGSHFGQRAWSKK
jgi:hypothetical protein